MKSIAVHDGVFHADDVFAAATIKLLYPDIEIVRTRDHDTLQKVDARIDVGKKNDPATLDFDHHMTEGAGARENGIPYAAFGLVWKHFGDQVTKDPQVTQYIDEQFVQLIDGPDCGYSVAEPTNNAPKVYAIPELVDAFNPSWDDDHEHDEAFHKVLNIATELLQRIIQKAHSKIRGENKVKELVQQNGDEPLLILDEPYPWKRMVTAESPIYYIIFPSKSQGHITRWNIRCVPKEKNSFENKKSLPKSWAGKDNKELQETTGIHDAIFCHRTCFIAAAKSKESAINMAQIAINNSTDL